MPSKIITAEQKQEIRDFYLSKPMTLAQLAAHYNLSSPTVGKILGDIPRYSKARLNNPDLKERFFAAIDNEEKAYFLGLLISDGNVFKEENSSSNRQASISITLDLKDEYMLQKFKEVVGTNTSIGHDGRGCGQIAVRSDLMADDLAKYGVIPRKTLHTYLPQIDAQYRSHLVRGIFDGDGSIQAKSNPNDQGRYLHALSFCGTHQLMSDIADLCNDIGLNHIPRVYDYKDKNLSDLKIQNKDDMFIFGEWMYHDATIFLTRKHDTYLAFKDHYQL